MYIWYLTMVKYHVKYLKVQYLDLCCFYCYVNAIGRSISGSTVKLLQMNLQAAAMHEIIPLREWFIANKLS